MRPPADEERPLRLDGTSLLTEMAEALYALPARLGLRGTLDARRRRALGGRSFAAGPDIAWFLGREMERHPLLFSRVPFTGREHVLARQRVLELRRLRDALQHVLQRTADTLLIEEAAMNDASLSVLADAEQLASAPLGASPEALELHKRLQPIRQHLRRRYRGRPAGPRLASAPAVPVLAARPGPAGPAGPAGSAGPAGPAPSDSSGGERS